ncbi:MAG: hypothetical protein M0R37_13360 [Bacteroidales bacterium]|nr:hypothetical protein [Bacteroidales bacterium]
MIKKNLVFILSVVFLLFSGREAGAQSYGESEILYIHTDRELYLQNDTIWMKGYLQNRSYISTEDLSRYIYVELCEDTVIKRVKLKYGEDGFSGYLSLNYDIEPKRYTLRAYTLNMQNYPSRLFFTKWIDVYSKNNENIIDNKNLLESDLSEDIDIQFLPESGRYIAGRPAKIAYKIIGRDGFSRNAEIKLYNRKDSLIGVYNPRHKGMGIINLFCVDSCGYYALIKGERGKELKVELPDPDTSGAMISLSRNNGKIIFSAFADKGQDSCILVIKNNSEVIYTKSLPKASCASGGYEFNSILLDISLPKGVNSMAIINAKGEILAERLFFVKNTDNPVTTINCDKDRYNNREKVGLVFSVKDTSGNPVFGEFSVSVTEKETHEKIPENDNMVSYMWLTGELSGNIEDPGYYFAENIPDRDRNLDLLMMTQGWRYHISGINTYKREYHQEISGETRGLFNKIPKNPNLMIYAPKIKLLQAYILDKQNTFTIENLDFPDSTYFILGVSGRHDGQLYSIYVNKDRFPNFEKRYFYQPQIKVSPEPVSQNVTTVEKQTVADMNRKLSEIVVSAPANNIVRPKFNPSPFNQSFSRNQIREREELDKYDGMSLVSYIITSFPNLYMQNGRIVSGRAFNMFTGVNLSPVIYIDCLPGDSSQIEALTTTDVENVVYLRGNDAFLYNTSASGAILITTRHWLNDKDKKANSNVIKINPLGYQKQVKFYSPKYDTEAKKNSGIKDLRKTVYWNPCIRSNKNGSACIDFYTSDTKENLTVTIEGLTSKGEAISETSTVEIKKEHPNIEK